MSGDAPCAECAGDLRHAQLIGLVIGLLVGVAICYTALRGLPA